MHLAVRAAPRRRGCMVFWLAAAVFCAAGSNVSAQAQPPAGQTRALAVRLESEFKGDFDAMVERRVIRVLAPHSRTLYFNENGRERGISADLVRDFEQCLNKKYKKQLGKRPITVVIIPTTRDQLLQRHGGGPRRHRGRQPDGHR